MSKLKTLGVFCGGSDGNNPAFLQAGRDLGKELAEKKIELVYGAGFTGIMGALGTSAHENKGRLVGVITNHLQRSERPTFTIDELIIVSSMHLRKDIMFNRSDAFCILPGGIGTLDELFEIMAMRQIGETNKPIIVANIDGFWDHFNGLLKELIKNEFAQEKHEHLVTVVNSVDEVIPTIERELASLNG
ncbi:MAG: TIGR00730 family Rossman fold protein [Alphaproteobacteria bacterium]|nr:TIGR00730 family Rossman fold protein [Elusimicrobiaceae bacterium]MBR7158750.1 TIGR00730 family Rossman fold protein [Alphaproteobacteria bacterium]